MPDLGVVSEQVLQPHGVPARGLTAPFPSQLGEAADGGSATWESQREHLPPDWPGTAPALGNIWGVSQGMED